MLKKPSLLAAALCLPAAVFSAQTATTVPIGISIPTENTHAVTGVRIRALPDGTVWFLVPSNDRIVALQGNTLKQWQIRDDKNIGANPVDFQLDGDVVWFICNGESLIDAGRSIFARLDTTTGALREWVLPGSKPAGFWRAPDGTVWIPQTDGRMQSFDPSIVQVDPKTGNSVVDKTTGFLVGGPVTDYRSHSADGTTFTFAYSDIVYGPDAALWLTDFGNNRIVRYEPGADTETSWTFFDPNVARLNPSQIRFDENGILWISELSGGRIDRFDPPNNILASYGGFASPIHFEIFQGRIYVAEATGSSGVVAVLDPNLTAAVGTPLTPLIVPVRHIVNAKPVLIRDSTITPTTFVSTINGFTTSDLTVTAGPVNSGILLTSFNHNNAYGITVADGYVWTGSEGEIVRLLLQNLGQDTDLTVPIVFEKAADKPPLEDRVDVTLANSGSSTISGNLFFLYSPASFAASVGFTVNPHSTSVIRDAFHNVQPGSVTVSGPVRVQVASGTAADLTASARSVHVRADGAAFGFGFPALDTYGGLGLGFQATLFTATRDAETATLGLFTSSAGVGANFTATLVAADGSVRGSRAFTLPNNTLEEFTPLASAFGLPAQTGDVVRISAGPGSVRAYVRLVDSGSGDTALSLPVSASGDAVLPFAATGLNPDGTGPVSDLFVSNPDPQNTAHVSVAYFASGPPAAPALATVVVPPGSTAVFADVLPSLLAVTSGSGAIVLTSDIPVASAARLAARQSDGDYAAVVGAYGASQNVPAGGSASASGLQEIPSVRSTDLVLFNRGAATSATVVGFDGNGSEIRRLTIDLGPGESQRLGAVLHQLRLDDLGAIDNARVRVDAPAGSQIYAAFAQTDAVTGDTEWVRPQ